jgi:hypothetical protein
MFRRSKGLEPKYGGFGDGLPASRAEVCPVVVGMVDDRLSEDVLDAAYPFSSQ